MRLNQRELQTRTEALKVPSFHSKSALPLYLAAIERTDAIPIPAESCFDEKYSDAEASPPPGVTILRSFEGAFLSALVLPWRREFLLS